MEGSTKVKKDRGSTETRTRITGFKVLGANQLHHRTGGREEYEQN